MITKNQIKISDWFEDVKEFHKKFDLCVGKLPETPSFDEVLLRISLIDEEYKELMSGIQQFSHVDISDACVDLIYVIIGTAIAYGIDIRPIWDIVHKSNMAKVGGGKNRQGKVLKPKGWVAPEKSISEELQKQLP